MDKRGSYGSIQTLLWFEIDDGYGYREACTKMPVLSSSTTATLNLYLPSYSVYFEQIKIVIATQNRLASTTVGLPGINPSRRNNQSFNAKKLCEQLNGQIKAMNLN
jgi:hypothetical protein